VKYVKSELCGKVKPPTVSQGATVLLGDIITYIIIIIISHKNVHNFYARQEVMQWSTDK